MNKNNILKAFFVVLAIIIAILLIKFMPTILLITVSLEEFKKYILSMGQWGVAVLILFQMLQTVVAPIPGEVVQIAGGYLYGIPLGTLYNLIGRIIGAVIAFYFARVIGGEYVRNLIEKKKLKWINDVMTSKKFEIVTFVIFIVPGLPKDFMIYVAGLTAIKPLRFFYILILARLPWVAVSASVGANIDAGNYIVTIIISAIAIIAFLIGIVYEDKIIKRLSR